MATINEKISLLDAKKEIFRKLPVIKNCYLIIGGGKIGTSFLQYARKTKLPFVIIIDKDQNAPTSKDASILKTENELIDLLRNKAKESPQVGTQPEIYFYKMDLHDIPFLLSFGIPEYIIPAVPCHAVAYTLSDLLVFPFEKNAEKTGQDKSYSSTYPLNEPLVSELFIKPENSEYSELMNFFEDVVSELPENIIAGAYPEQGILFLSYAQAGEMCPDDCPGPRTHCPTFGRKKPETITEYVRKLTKKLPGQVFESYQMKPGIGGLKGVDFKGNYLEILEFLISNLEIQNSKKIEKPRRLEDRAFFVATTCTCHGILNLFYFI